MSDAWDEQLRSLGSYIRTQRKMANLSLRKAAELADISNPYWSQLERGMHEPSVRVLNSIAKALNMSAEALLEQAGVFPRTEGDDGAGTEAAIRSDPHLTEDQKLALLSVYRSYVASLGGDGVRPSAHAGASEGDHDET
jgi:transcriptional regulator with XRE-family HTH domain